MSVLADLAGAGGAGPHLRPFRKTKWSMWRFKKPVVRDSWFPGAVSTVAGGAGCFTVALRRKGVGRGQGPIAVIEADCKRHFAASAPAVSTALHLRVMLGTFVMSILAETAGAGGQGPTREQFRKRSGRGGGKRMF